MARDRIGNTRKTAEPLKLGTKATVIQESIGGTDAADVFKVAFKNRTSLDVQLSGLQKPVQIELQTQKGKTLFTSSALSKTSQVLARTVDAGTYFLEVSAPKGETVYKLSGVANGDRAGENHKTARKISLSSKLASFKDFSGRSDQTDYYRFTVDQSREVDLSLTGVSQPLKLILEDKSGNVLKTSKASKTTNATLSQTLDVGTYYARVSYSGKAVGTAYRLQGSVFPPLVSQAFSEQWITQFGSSANDYAYDIDVDGNGNLYMAGLTEGNLQGSNKGGRDAFLALADSSGQVQSIQQFSTSNSDVFSGVALGGNGNIYTVGAKNVKAALLSPTGNGALGLYTRSGTTLSESKQVSFSEDDITAGSDIAVDANNNVYVAGGAIAISLSPSSTGFVAKFDANGNKQTLGNDIGSITSTGAATSVALDQDGNIYVAGITRAQIQFNPNNPYTGGDAFVAKFDSSGQRLWLNTLGGRGTEEARRLAVDSKGNVYIVGSTEGSLPGNTSSGGVDAFVAKYNANGKRLWVDQFGTDSLDEAQGIVVDPNDNVYVTGETNGSLFKTAIGGSDAWIVKYDPFGRVVASSQIGTTSDDETYGITVDNTGNVYVVGQTLGDFGGTNQGSYDVWFARYSVDNL
ncbi:MAG: SBBP repeat-containing protein [Synechococcales cyanobacterium T60_A2020_003]|nr:SBBP repeat-containing protein [Synechococcales cyanobacterium T60_A2020_003]